jgi:hypothetical protein
MDAKSRDLALLAFLSLFCAISAWAGDRAPKTAMKNRNPGFNEGLEVWRPRWGRLQTRALYALIDGLGEATGAEISKYCWDHLPKPQ